MGVGMWQKEEVWAEGTGHGQGHFACYLRAGSEFLRAERWPAPAAIFLPKYFSGYDNGSRRRDEEGIDF